MLDYFRPGMLVRTGAKWEKRDVMIEQNMDIKYKDWAFLVNWMESQSVYNRYHEHCHLWSYLSFNHLFNLKLLDAQDITWKKENTKHIVFLNWHIGYNEQ